MLVAYRPAGLSALEAYYARVAALTQTGPPVAVALARPAHGGEAVDVPAFKPDVALALLVAMRIMF
jgi:hypothetical protein